MADLPLAMLFGGTLCLYFAVGRRKIAYWLVALPLAVLTLTKDICFAYGLIAAFLIGLDLWLAADEPAERRSPRLCSGRAHWLLSCWRRFQAGAATRRLSPPRRTPPRASAVRA